MKSLTLRVGLGVLLFGLAVTAIFWIWRGEWVSVETDAGYSDEVRRNGLYAAEQFLRARGVKVRMLEVDGPSLLLPPVNFAFLFNAPRSGLNEAARRQLREWVQRGGHLITIPAYGLQDPSGSGTDALFKELGIEVLPAPSDEEEDDDSSSDSSSNSPSNSPSKSANETTLDAASEDEPAYDTDGCLVSYTADVRLPPEILPLHFAVSDGTRLRGRRGQSLATDHDGSVLLQVPFGRGAVTAVSSYAPWLNSELGCHDHAHILFRLLGGRPGVWLVESAVQSDWWDLIQHHGKGMLTSVAILLGLLLWRYGGHFGPLLERTTGVRRRRGEQLRAVGEFHWRHRDGAALLAGLRELVRRNARRRVGDADAFATLAAQGGVDAALAHAAMHDVPKDEGQLILMTRCLKELIKVQ